MRIASTLIVWVVATALLLAVICTAIFMDKHPVRIRSGTIVKINGNITYVPFN